MKIHRVAVWITKQGTPICFPQETNFKSKDTKIKSEGMWKDIHVNWNEKKDGVAIFIPDKINFKTKTVKRDKGGITKWYRCQS